MAPRIDPNLLETIKIEFEHGIQPLTVLEHVRDAGMPVSQPHLYLLYNRWRESGQLHADPETYRQPGPRQIIQDFMLVVSFSLGSQCY